MSLAPQTYRHQWNLGPHHSRVRCEKLEASSSICFYISKLGVVIGQDKIRTGSSREFEHDLSTSTNSKFPLSSGCRGRFIGAMIGF